MNHTKRLRVLIVDDDPGAAHGVAEMVRLNGHEARVAHDGRSALRQARDDDFQLVLLDIGLPDMDGYELARRLTLLGLRRLAIVALTGYGAGDYLRRSDSAGLDDHIVKPCSAEQLERVLNAAVARAGHSSAVRRRLSAA